MMTRVNRKEVRMRTKKMVLACFFLLQYVGRSKKLLSNMRFEKNPKCQIFPKFHVKRHREM